MRKKITSRATALILTLAMCLGMLPVTALAADAPIIRYPQDAALLFPPLDLEIDDIHEVFYRDNADVPGAPTYEEAREIYGWYEFNRMIIYPESTGKTGSKELPSWNLIGHNPYYTEFLPYSETANGMEIVGWSDDKGNFYAEGDEWTLPHDSTVYSVWDVIDAAYTVTFDSNGSSDTYPAQSVHCRDTVQLPDAPELEGYSFMGWYTGTPKNGVLVYPVKWTENDMVIEDVTLYAMYEEEEAPAETHYVHFNSNGGLTVAISQEVPHGGTVKLPEEDPTRTGYTFLGWYTGTLQEDGTLTNAVKWTADRVVTEETTLYALWEETPKVSYTVTFDMSGAPLDPPVPQTIQAGSPITPPAAPLLDGYRFLGWYTEDNKLWDEKSPVLEDMTLHAGWDYDRFSFSNTSGHFFKGPRGTYAITGKYLEALRDGLSPAYWADKMSPKMNSTWGGSCFGMSVLFCLRYADRIEPDSFQTGAQILYDLERPALNEEVFNLVNYYHLQQYRPESSGADYDYARNNTSYYQSYVTAGIYQRNLTNDMMRSGQPAIVVFSYKNPDRAGGHAVVALNCEKTGPEYLQEYVLDIWDPNQEATDRVVLNHHQKTAVFDSGAYQNVKISGFLNLDDCEETFDQLNMEEYLHSTETVSSNVVILTTSLHNYIVAASDGTYAEFKDGEQVGGTLELAIGMNISGQAADSVDYYLPKSDSYTVTVADDDESTVGLLMGDVYAEVTASEIETITFTGTSVETVCAEATQQTVSITADTLGETWNQVTVTGKDAGLTVEAQNESVNITSVNNVSVDVVGENVFSERKSAARKVSVTPAGTTVSTSADALTAAEGPAGDSENPFTDVADGAYYYDAVLWAVENGITNGTSATTFGPNDTCTRAQTVTFLWRAAGSPEPAGSTNPFTDVKADAYYYKAVLWAVEKGITSGTSATTFGPNEVCNRAQTVTFLHRAAGAPVVQAANPFTDVKAGSYYEKPVLWAVANGITNGTSAATFGPNDTCNRGQIVTFLWRFDALDAAISGLEISG